MPRSSAVPLPAAAMLAACVLAVGPAAAGEVALGFGAGAGGAFRVTVDSVQERRFSGILRQEHDFSCGSAALASLLSFHYDRPHTEHEVFQSMYAGGDKEQIERYGFSLLDMKRFLERAGIPSDGFQVPLDRLQQAGIPAITLIDTDGYKHFVLLKGITDTHVLVGDPALGLKRLPREEFTAVWNGIAFVVRADLELGRAGFNRPEAWNMLVSAPAGTAALSRSALATITTTTYRAGNTY